jgi:hypothetical protein
VKIKLSSNNEHVINLINQQIAPSNVDEIVSTRENKWFSCFCVFLNGVSVATSKIKKYQATIYIRQKNSTCFIMRSECLCQISSKMRIYDINDL